MPVETLHAQEIRDVRSVINGLYMRAWIAAANGSEPTTIPLVLGQETSHLFPVSQGHDPMRSAVEQGALEELRILFAPGSPGGNSRHQVGLNGAHLGEILRGISFSAQEAHLDQLRGPNTFISLIAESRNHGGAICLMAGRSPSGTHLAFVTTPGILPAMSGA